MIRKTALGVASSRPEERLHKILQRKFGPEAVKRQIRVGKWTVDFYVEPLQTYVELDGVHWHGLDRPIEEIAAEGTRRSRRIVARHTSDQMQNEWFAGNSLRLVRFTDREIRSLSEREIFDKISAKYTEMD